MHEPSSRLKGDLAKAPQSESRLKGSLVKGKETFEEAATSKALRNENIEIGDEFIQKDNGRTFKVTYFNEGKNGQLIHLEAVTKPPCKVSLDFDSFKQRLDSGIAWSRPEVSSPMPDELKWDTGSGF